MGYLRNLFLNGILDNRPDEINGSLPDTIEKHDTYNEKIDAKVRDFFKANVAEWNTGDTKFYVTKATIKIEEMLRAQHCVLVVGRSGNGKSSIIRHIALQLLNKDGYDIVPFVSEPTTVLQYVNPKRKQIFVIDDFCGKEFLNAETVKMWSSHINDLLSLIQTSEKGALKLLFATGSDVFDDALFNSCIRLSQYKFHLSELPLKDDEKIEMIKKYCTPEQISGTLTSTLKSHENIFPLLCKLSEGKTVDQIIKLFTNPKEVIRQDFVTLKEKNKTKICLIALCVLLESLKDDIFCRHNTTHDRYQGITSEQHKIVKDVCLQFGLDISDESSRSKLEHELKILDHVDETYFVKSGNAYDFVHTRIYDIAAIFCGETIINTFIKVAPSSFIAERYIYFESKDEESADFICIPNEETLKIYFERLLEDLKNGITYSTFHNRQLQNKSYRKSFRDYCRREKRLVDYLNQLGNKKPHEKTTMNEYTDYIEFTKSCHFSSHNMRIPLIESAWEGYEDIVFMLIKMKCKVNETDRFGRSALFVACKRGKEKVALQLLANGAEHSMRDNNQISPLLAVCVGGYVFPTLIDELLEKTGNASECDKDGCSPLHAASVASHKRIVEELLKTQNNANISDRDKSGRSALFLALYNGRKTVADILLAKYKEEFKEGSINETDYKGFTPLIAACSDGKLNAVTDLLEREADISSIDKNGRSALFTACKKGENKMVDILLKKNADVSQCDLQGRSPLFIACSLGHEKIANSLVKSKAEISQRNKDGKSPLFLACEKGRDNILDILLDKCSVRDLEIVDNKGRSPLYVASKGGFNEIVEKLVCKGANVNVSNVWKMTPLFVASREGHPGIVQYLIKKKANLELQVFTGRTPLSVACDDGNEEVVKILIRNGSNINHKDQAGETPCTLAHRSGHEGIVKFLLEQKTFKGKKPVNKVLSK